MTTRSTWDMLGAVINGELILFHVVEMRFDALSLPRTITRRETSPSAPRSESITCPNRSRGIEHSSVRRFDDSAMQLGDLTPVRSLSEA